MGRDKKDLNQRFRHRDRYTGEFGLRASIGSRTRSPEGNSFGGFQLWEETMSRNFLVTAVAAASLVAFSASGFAQEAIKSSKSDTSDRMGGGGGAKGAGALPRRKS